METYKIVRFYQHPDMSSETVETGLTLEDAKAHCHDPETSSSTCTEAEGVKRTEMYGAWFDGWTEE